MDHAKELIRIGEAIGFGNSADILCKAWDDMLNDKHGIKPYHGDSWMAAKRHAIRAQECLKKEADFNFEQYQDAGAELCKLGEQCDELVTALSAAREIIMSRRKSFFHCNKNPATGKIEDPCDLAALFDYDRALNLIDGALARFKGTV